MDLILKATKRFERSQQSCERLCLHFRMITAGSVKGGLEVTKPEARRLIGKLLPRRGMMVVCPCRRGTADGEKIIDLVV